MNADMTLETFETRLDALGADISRWPEPAAGEAGDLLARSADARAMHAQARRLAALIGHAAEAPTPQGFEFRVVGEVASRRAERFSWLTYSPGRLGLAGASFCVAAVAIGVGLGAMTGPAQAGGDVLGAYDAPLVDSDF